MRRRLAGWLFGGMALFVLGCGTAETPEPLADGGLPDGGQLAQPDAGTRDGGSDGGVPDGGLPDGGLPDGGADAGSDAGVSCLQGEAPFLLACLRNGTSPDDCLGQVPGRLCDSDGDGVGDDLEAAVITEYAPTFAFNGGTAGDNPGDPETMWPANVNHFVTHAKAYYRPQDGGSDVLVDGSPTLATLASETFGSGADAHPANDPGTANGSAFYLCLNDGSDGTRVSSKEAMLALPDGVDVTALVQPANGTLANSTHLLVSYQLFFAYNLFASVDNHEGDWEGVLLFVNRMNGKVDSAYFGRHGTTDGDTFVSSATYAPKDAAAYEPSRGQDLSGSDPSIHGLRFRDFGGLRHRLVAFVSAGSHAMYDYPANTFVKEYFGVGVRDTHNGDGPWFDTGTAELLQDGAVIAEVDRAWRTPGQLGHVLEPWARYRGQWGCQEAAIAQSWPGPWGNVKHPRPELERAWGSPPTAP